MARSIMESLIDKGRVTRGWLGVLIQNLDEQMAEGFGFEGTEGVLIGDVMEGSPAERGGLQPGDIVLKFDGEEVADVNELRNRVAATEPGSKVPVVIFRDGERETLQVPIEQMEEGATVAAERTEEAENLGMTVGNIDEETADKLGLKNTRGVLVLEVERGSPAARAGVRPNDVILAVNRRRVQTMADYRKAMQQAEAGRGVLLRVKSDDLTRYVFVRPE
jgi:serine protease Do